MNKLEQVEAYIRKVCPETMEPTLGCQVVYGDDLFEPREVTIGEPYLLKGDIVYNPLNLDDKSCLVKILGHPIRISHVLRAMNTPMNCDYLIDGAGCFWDTSEDEMQLVGPLSDGKIQWNLEQDDLSLQSEDVKMFLFDLLCEND